ncbi:MAG: membrane-bound O-acyltransferase family protein [Kordia sp.]|nr:MAG: membrane-bound O-acyltransferase family protein [Kordia sp.]
MIFNSIEFVLFLPLVFLLYWFVFKNRSQQNILLLVASYFFYGWWDWRFLLLILFSSILDFVIAKKIQSNTNNKTRKVLLLSSLCFNLGVLFYFKYCNFFIESFTNAFTFFGQEITSNHIDVILPVGISFYTFQTLSYTIDVYKRKLSATKDVVSFFAFVSFFPQLVAGPIERATNLLPQFLKERKFQRTLAILGVKLIIWGMFKKIVIADNTGILVDLVYDNFETQNQLALLIAAVLFSFQIYCDFSGYSDIAIGVSRLFGFNLMTNFSFPYFSRDIAEFWRRWHISLSTWFRDYVYIPLGGSKVFKIRNVFIVFLLSGFWHGANMTFIFWGLIHAILFIPLFITGRYLKNKHSENIDKINIKPILSTILTFSMVTLAWVFFRAENITEAFLFVERIFINDFNENVLFSSNKYLLILLISVFSILTLLFIEALFYMKNKMEVTLSGKWLLFLIVMIAFFGAFKNHSEFIYFQF